MFFDLPLSLGDLGLTCHFTDLLLILLLCEVYLLLVDFLLFCELARLLLKGLSQFANMLFQLRILLSCLGMVLLRLSFLLRKLFQVGKHVLVVLS